MKDSLLVSIFTITFNQEERIVKTLEGLFEQDYSKDMYEIVVLDDGSQDGTQSALNELAAQSPVPLIIVSCQHEADYLSAKRWNQAIAACNNKSQVFIHIEDVEVRPDLISRHASWHAQPTEYLITGSKFESDNTTWELSACQRSHLAGTDAKPKIIEQYTAVWSASMSYTRKAINKIYNSPFDVPYDERMTGWGFHEVEFAYRMQQSGVLIVYDPQAGVFHKNHMQTMELRRGMDRNRLVTSGSIKNEQYVLKKHGLMQLPRW